MIEPMDEVRRGEDGELCGFVAAADGRWHALTLFGVAIGEHDHRDAAVEQVLGDGLAVLAERWTLRNGATGDDEVVCIVEANAVEVVVARGYYAMPGVPTLAIQVEQLAAGEWSLHR